MDGAAAKVIYEGINRTTLADLRRDLLKAAIRYASKRVEYAVATVEDRQSMDA